MAPDRVSDDELAELISLEQAAAIARGGDAGI